MDSVTQVVLGAAVGEVMLGRKLGNKALLLGAIAGTIPDLDVVLNLFTHDPISKLRIHRSYSHSMFTHFVLALPLTWLSLKWSKAEISKARWYWFWFLGLFTHALLDCCTTYGTRLFLPFTSYQVAFNNVSVVDPLYTVPFMLILIACMFFKRSNPKRLKIAWASIIVSSLYMLLTFGLKYGAHQKFIANFEKQYPTIKNVEFNSTPTILNAILWSGIAYNQDSLWVAEYSFLRNDIPVTWTGYPRNEPELKNYDCRDLKTMLWFADDNYFSLKKGDTLQFYNVKWGRFDTDQTDPTKAFGFYYNFYKGPDGNIHNTATEPEFKGDEMKKAFGKLMTRIGI